MIKGESISLTIESLDEAGAGVGTLSNADGALRVHVPFALPSERVAAELQHRSPHRPEAWARCTSVVVASEARVEAACAAWGQCGGCALQHLRYPEQLAWKRGQLAEALPTVTVEETVASPLQLGYRNKSKLVVGRRSPLGGLVLGAYAPRSHDVVDLAGCRVVEPPLDDVAQVLRELAERLGVLPYDEATGDGELRHAVLRMNVGGEILVVLVVARRGAHSLPQLARTLREARPQVVGVVENLQPEPSNNLYGDAEPDLVLDGVQAIEERVGATRLRLSPRAFLQVNRGVAARLYQAVSDAVTTAGAERVVDVYCGVGGIALTVAPRVREVIGIEELPQAVADARAGADLNQLPNARFHAGDAAELLADARVVGERADAVILNPPRKGCARTVLAAAARLAPRTIVYVSCHPSSLARDLAQLDGLGYRARVVTPYDMLPHTPHVEALALLTPT